MASASGGLEAASDGSAAEADLGGSEVEADSGGRWLQTTRRVESLVSLANLTLGSLAPR